MMLYIVASPIGNLSDLSRRAEEVIKNADIVLAEDTRQTVKLLHYLNIKKKLISCHEHTNDSRLELIINQIANINSAVYLTDAGTPNLSDPGGRLIDAALSKGINIVPIPGPSALTTLISASPFPCSKFQFIGYFPKKRGREKMISIIQRSKIPVFFFESSHRICKTLDLLKGKLLQKNIIIGRELSKKFEQIIVSSLDTLDVESIPDKGEFVIGIY